MTVQLGPVWAAESQGPVWPSSGGLGEPGHGQPPALARAGNLCG